MPRVSVIVPNYNHAEFLEQRIESILNQTCQDFELILLDDNSTDESIAILHKYKHHPKVSQWVVNSVNSGSPFVQWNLGVSLAKGEYVWIAESDDWAELTFLEEMLSVVDRFKGVVLAYSLAKYINRNGEEAWKMNETNATQFFQGKEYVRRFLINANVIYNVSMTLIHRESYMKTEYRLIESMKLCGDWLLYVMICLQGNVVCVNKALSNYRIHDTNTSATAEKKGLSFLEGFRILSYIRFRENRPIGLSEYFSWAKQWVKYQRKFGFSSEVNSKIIKQAFKDHFAVLIFYFGYRLYYKLKNVNDSSKDFGINAGL